MTGPLNRQNGRIVSFHGAAGGSAGVFTRQPTQDSNPLCAVRAPRVAVQCKRPRRERFLLRGNAKCPQQSTRGVALRMTAGVLVPLRRRRYLSKERCDQPIHTAVRRDAARRADTGRRRSDQLAGVSGGRHRCVRRRARRVPDLFRRLACCPGHGAGDHRPPFARLRKQPRQHSRQVDGDAGAAGDGNDPDRAQPRLRDLAAPRPEDGRRFVACHAGKPPGRPEHRDRHLPADAGRRPPRTRDRHRAQRHGLGRCARPSAHQGARRCDLGAIAVGCRIRFDARQCRGRRRRRFRDACGRDGGTPGRTLGQRPPHRAASSGRPATAGQAPRFTRCESAGRAGTDRDHGLAARAHRQRLQALQAGDGAAPHRAATPGHGLAEPARVQRFFACQLRRNRRAAERPADQRHQLLPRCGGVRDARCRARHEPVRRRGGTEGNARLGRRLCHRRRGLFGRHPALRNRGEARPRDRHPHLCIRHRRAGDCAGAHRPVPASHRGRCLAGAAARLLPARAGAFQGAQGVAREGSVRHAQRAARPAVLQPRSRVLPQPADLPRPRGATAGDASAALCAPAGRAAVSRRCGVGRSDRRALQPGRQAAPDLPRRAGSARVAHRCRRCRGTRA